MTEPTIEDYFLEERTFPPSEGFAAAALVSDDSLHREAEVDFEAFWARQARELLTWSRDFDTTLEWNLPDAKWFLGGELNVSVNTIRTHAHSIRRKLGVSSRLEAVRRAVELGLLS